MTVRNSPQAFIRGFPHPPHEGLEVLDGGVEFVQTARGLHLPQPHIRQSENGVLVILHTSWGGHKEERVKPDTDSAWLRLTCQVGQLLGEGPLEDVSTQHRACRVHVNSAHV